MDSYPFVSSDESNESQKAPTRMPLHAAFQRSQSFSRGGTMCAKMDDALLFMICKDKLALNTPNNTGFRYFAKVAAPLWSPPSRPTLTSNLEAKFSVMRESVRKALIDADSFTLTCDAWSETHSNRGFLGMTVHWLKDLELKTATVGLVPLKERHTSEYLSTKLQEICQEWSISHDRVQVCITDNAENIKKAVKETFGASKQLPCFAHTLNLIPQEALSKNSDGNDNVPGVPALIAKVKEIVTFFKHSNNASDELRKLQYDAGKTEGTALRLIQSVPTRWNSTFHMLQRFLELSHFVNQVLWTHHNSSMPTVTEMSSLKCITAMLAPLERVTSELSSEQTTSASKAIPLVHIMKKKIEMLEPPSPTDAARHLKDFILAAIDRRFGSIEHVRILRMATILDPRYKKLHFQSPIAASQAVSDIASEVKRLLREKKALLEGEIIKARADSASCAAPVDDFWDIHDELVVQNRPTHDEDTAGGLPVELRQYLNRPVILRHEDPIKHWESMKESYPQLYVVARRVLSALATSVPSERVFSHAGGIANETRSKLTDDHLSMLLFLGSLSIDHWLSRLTV